LGVGSRESTARAGARTRGCDSLRGQARLRFAPRASPLLKPAPRMAHRKGDRLLFRADGKPLRTVRQSLILESPVRNRSGDPGLRCVCQVPPFAEPAAVSVADVTRSKGSKPVPRTESRLRLWPHHLKQMFTLSHASRVWVTGMGERLLRCDGSFFFSGHTDSRSGESLGKRNLPGFE